MAGINKSPYHILRRPRITEKAALVSSYDNCVIVDVMRDANKVEIKRAVETVFDVEVDKVRTVNMKGKLRRVGFGQTGLQSDWKKAYVYLKEGSTIDFIEGL